MATQSTIWISNVGKQGHKIYVGQYCHFDGYLNGVGKILLEQYTDEEKIRKMIALGSMSSIGASIECPEGHTYDTPIDGYTVFYTRDRGEPMSFYLTEEKLDTINKYGERYNYLYDDGQWMVQYWANSTFVPLKEELENYIQKD